jgi:iron-sulfur cluster assembly protein
MIAVSNKILPLTLTPRAIAQVKAIMAHKLQSHQEYGLRIGIKGGGCSGASFLLGFDKAKTGDETYMHEDIPVIIEKKHMMYLLGMEVDYEESEEGAGFVFNNPQA